MNGPDYPLRVDRLWASSQLRIFAAVVRSVVDDERVSQCLALGLFVACGAPLGVCWAWSVAVDAFDHVGVVGAEYVSWWRIRWRRFVVLGAQARLVFAEVAGACPAAISRG
jgi:hypothetical protein